MPPRLPASSRPQLTDDQLIELLAGRLVAQLQPELNKINQAITRIDTRLDIQTVTTQKHDQVLYGNGKEGIITTVSHLKKLANVVTWIAGIVVGVVVTSAIGAFIFLVQTHPPGGIP
jgi:hypothetical protein